MITIDDFKKCEIKIGTILSAERVPEADKLIKISVDLGEAIPRQIVSGISAYFPDPSVLIGRQIPILVNLAPRMIRGLESNGMALYVVGETLLTTLSPAEVVPNGTVIR